MVYIHYIHYIHYIYVLYRECFKTKQSLYRTQNTPQKCIFGPKCISPTDALKAYKEYVC